MASVRVMPTRETGAKFGIVRLFLEKDMPLGRFTARTLSLGSQNLDPWQQSHNIASFPTATAPYRHGSI